MLDATGYRNVLREADDAESDARLGNLEELVGSIADYEEEAETSERAATLGGYLERITLAAPSTRSKTRPKVSLMTVHSAKGLEFHAVFLTGMEEEMFPYRGVSGRRARGARRGATPRLRGDHARARAALHHARSMRSLFGTTR